MPTILVIDDNAAVATALETLFSLHDIDTLTAASPDAGLATLEAHAVDLVVQDMNFDADTTSGDEGVALFHAIRSSYPDLPVILLTAWTRLEAAVELVRAGAADYLGKPWDDHKLLATVNNLLELSETRRELARLQRSERRRRDALAEYDLRGLVYADAASERAISLAWPSLPTGILATMFLDEIGTLPPAGQVKLLRVLETGRFERLGSNRERQVKVRVVSATSADLALMIQDGRFREDLYYRLNAIEVKVPPLAGRIDDILPLARHFLPAGNSLSTEAERALLAHAWPGNVRELRNTLQRGALLARNDSITAAELGLPQPFSASSASAEEPDREAIEAALARHGGVMTQAASELGLSRQALYRRLERLGITRD